MNPRQYILCSLLYILLNFISISLALGYLNVITDDNGYQIIGDFNITQDYFVEFTDYNQNPWIKSDLLKPINVTTISVSYNSDNLFSYKLRVCTISNICTNYQNVNPFLIQNPIMSPTNGGIVTVTGRFFKSLHNRSCSFDFNQKLNIIDDYSAYFTIPESFTKLKVGQDQVPIIITFYSLQLTTYINWMNPIVISTTSNTYGQMVVKGINLGYDPNFVTIQLNGNIIRQCKTIFSIRDSFYLAFETNGASVNFNNFNLSINSYGRNSSSVKMSFDPTSNRILNVFYQNGVYTVMQNNYQNIRSMQFGQQLCNISVTGSSLICTIISFENSLNTGYTPIVELNDGNILFGQDIILIGKSFISRISPLDIQEIEISIKNYPTNIETTDISIQVDKHDCTITSFENGSIICARSDNFVNPTPIIDFKIQTTPIITTEIPIIYKVIYSGDLVFIYGINFLKPSIFSIEGADCVFNSYYGDGSITYYCIKINTNESNLKYPYKITLSNGQTYNGYISYQQTDNSSSTTSGDIPTPTPIHSNSPSPSIPRKNDSIIIGNNNSLQPIGFSKYITIIIPCAIVGGFIIIIGIIVLIKKREQINKANRKKKYLPHNSPTMETGPTHQKSKLSLTNINGKDDF